ncbi:unnamed protein product [Pieris brassicae]|uniref:Uncharacterized protein n=1 Tax=Pieris brassicae TaxID=7116 RepID=A0A9P0TNW7_PIEBR|nr:unnamed protein product [Pieris brassicae]
MCATCQANRSTNQSTRRSPSLIMSSVCSPLPRFPLTPPLAPLRHFERCFKESASVFRYFDLGVNPSLLHHGSYVNLIADD